MRFSLFLALSAFPLLAQFSELATTYDGQELYFSSQLFLTRTPPVNIESRLFRVKNGQVKLFAERDITTPDLLGGGSSSDGAGRAQPSNDGLTVGYTVRGQCVVPNSCTATSFQSGELAVLRGSSDKTLGAGSLAMSKNAQWAVLTNQPSVISERGPLAGVSAPVPFPAAESVLINLTTNERVTLPEAVAGFTRPGAVVASDGSVLLSGAQGAGVWKAGKLTPLIVPGGVGLQMLSDNGRMIVYSQLLLCSLTTGCPNPRFLVRDTWTGIDTLISNTTSTALGISNDGQRLLYRNVGPPTGAGKAFVVNVLGGDSAEIPLLDGELSTDGTLSGDGNTAFLVTTTGRIVSVDLLHGLAIHTVVAPTFYLSNSLSFSAGSLVHLTGVLPSTVDAVKGKILLNDAAIPVIYANADEVAVQIPWEAPIKATLRLNLPSESPFQQNLPLILAPAAMRFEQPASGQPNLLGFLAIKGDFSGLVTANPAPGDVIIAYATGLGPVLNHPPTGQPTPTDRLFPIQGTLSCRFSPYTLPAETLFAGLAPGLTGLYQINFRLPPGPNPGAITGGQCSLSGPGFSSSFIWSQLTTPR